MDEIIKYDQNTKLAVKPEEDFYSPRVFYHQLDPSHYTFTYKTDDVFVRMDESDRNSKNTEFIDAEFTETVSETDRSCYIAAAVSGLLTGVLRNVGIADAFEEKIEKFKENNREWEKYVSLVARLLGYAKSDYDGALVFLKKRAIQFTGGNASDEVSDHILKSLLRLDFHPTIVGLIFSITSQFTEKQYSIDKDNKLKSDSLPEYYTVGRNYHEKLVYGFMYWVFGLSLNIRYSERNILDNLNLPKELIRIIKGLLETTVMKGIPENSEESSKTFSGWLKNLFENSKIEENSESFDLEESINLSMKGVYRDTIPIILNECIFRSFYFIHKLSIEIKENGIQSVTELNKIDPANVLPFNNRTVSRMCVIASGSYFGINVARCVIERIKGKKAGDKDFSDTLFDIIDIAGLGRFIIAVGMDIPYWKEDFDLILERMAKGEAHEETEKESTSTVQDDEDYKEYENVYDKFMLDPLQTRILYALEAIAVKKDIEKTKDESARQQKEEWFGLWKSRLISGFSDDSAFEVDEDKLYEGILTASKDKDNARWLYMISAELALFEPYHPLGVKQDKGFKKLKTEYDYIRDQYIRRQTIVSQDEIDAYVKKYKKYYGTVSGNNMKLAAGAGIATIVTLASGGAALAFAPQIAIALAGEAVVGLHGAALTSASLALVGGGSLAAGGLGMAGGTAIIAGGGALLGLASSGSASVASMLMQTDNTFMPRQAAKMLSFSDTVLKSILHDEATIQQLCKKTDSMILKSQGELKELQDEDNDLDKERISKLKDYIKCLTRFRDGLKNLLK